MSAVASAMLAFIATSNVDVDPCELMLAIRPKDIGQWFDELQALISAQYVVRVPSTSRRYFYRATNEGVRYALLFRSDRMANA